MPKFWSTFTVSFEWWESVSSSYAQTGFAIQYFAWCAICAWYIFLNPQCERTCFHCADIHIMLHWLERAVQYVINFHTINNLRARHSCRCFLEKYDLGKNVKIIFFDNWCPVWHSVVGIVVMPTNSIFLITTFNSCCLEFERKTCQFTAPCLGKFPRRGIWLQEKHWTVAVTLSPCFPYLLSLLKAEHKIHLECKMIFCAFGGGFVIAIVIFILIPVIPIFIFIVIMLPILIGIVCLSSCSSTCHIICCNPYHHCHYLPRALAPHRHVSHSC